MWSSLGDMAQNEARRTFIKEVTRLMPHLLPYLEAHAEDDKNKDQQTRLHHENNG